MCVRIVCLAISSMGYDLPHGRCIAGISLDTGRWIRLFGSHASGAIESELIHYRNQPRTPCRVLDLFEVELGEPRPSNIHPEDVNLLPSGFTFVRRFNQPADIDFLESHLERNSPLLHSYSKTIPADDPLLKRRLSHSLSIIRPEQLHWKVGLDQKYKNKLRIEADFRFDEDPYCLVLTDPIWKARCEHFGHGRHPHSTIAGEANGQVLLTISLAREPKYGFHYKLVAGVVNLMS
jgi:hypothetical protein